MTRSTRTAKTFFVLAASTLLLAGCSPTTPLPNTSHHATSTESPSNAKFSSADIMFAQMMIPHHQQAVDMGTLAETRASNPKVRDLASKIKSEQAPEIDQMHRWLKAAGASLDMGHSMVMDGMLTTSQMKALAASSGATFDRLFLEGMIGHHQGAIKMAQKVIDSHNGEASALGHSIVDSQSKQIAVMKQLLLDQ